MNIRLHTFIEGESITPFKIKKNIENDCTLEIANKTELADWLRTVSKRPEDEIEYIINNADCLMDRVHSSGFDIIPDGLKVEAVEDNDGRGYSIDVEVNVTFEEYEKLCIPHYYDNKLSEAEYEKYLMLNQDVEEKDYN